MASTFDLSALSSSLLFRNLAIPGLIAVLVVAGSLVRWTTNHRQIPLPPSPPGSHWLNGHTFPRRKSNELNPFLQVERWIQEYGPIITVKQGLQTVVIIGRYHAAVDILEKQGGLSTDRPRSVAVGEILSGDHRLVLASGDRFRRMRKAMHSHLQPKAAESYQPIQMTHARDVILKILDKPEDFQSHASAFAASVVLQVAYGKTSPTLANDPEVQAVHRALERIRVALRPNAYLVESFPFLRYLPLYAPELKQGYREDSELYMRQLGAVRTQMNNDEGGPSFSRYLLKNESNHMLNELEMAYLAGSFFTAGSDPTALGICTVLMCAALHPEAQAIVQNEIDAIIRRDKAPTFADENALPQLKAFISEALRWRPIVGMGFQHRTSEDVVWGNYCIPAGTTVMGNHWAISRDPEVFPDGDHFNPKRWKTSKGEMRDDIRFFTFGFGRRVCPGQHVANRSVFINTLLILWAFRLSMRSSQPVDDTAYMQGVTPKKQMFDIGFEPRIEERDLRTMMDEYGGME
ncbi:cytochrome P450 [Coniophora puteana RWD-64-598 SS2]|uniref:Cytochrome P450 n=1 Tax=Coniophora puteana (strain RWD-64-598) TaxID=741705 RepID=R7SCX8_CONPW|nr:cytochrome P450 [Coniophora puteana RWD-64-598 SS2]EIW74031.1 cytochrome P450 [Coniophora puteana RWD-64-598 SS2]